MKRILGIDTGTNSIGWAVVDRDENGLCALVKKGSLIFQEGVKIEKGIESSKAAERSGYRALRKHYFRRRLRKIEVLKVLVKYHWCPYISPESLHEWHVNKQYPMDADFLQWQRTDEAMDKNPYTYRHICLHEKLDLDKESDRFILGRAMYHLAQRRGFKSNRLDQSEDDASGVVKGAISDLSAEMAAAGYEYLGDYFHYLYQENKHVLADGKTRIRSRYTDRESQYLKEFYAICEKQCLSEEQVNELKRALYFQRPLKSQRHSVGKCTFEKQKPRCADSHPAYERFRMLSLVNNIKIMGPDDDALRPLSNKELEKINPLFFRKTKPQFDFEDIAKALAGKGKYQHIKDVGNKPYKFNYRMSQSVSGCPTIAALIEVFGKDYSDAIAETYLLSAGKTKEEMVDDVWKVLYSFPDRENVKKWGMERLQLSDEDADKFSKIRISHDFASLSLAAIRRILPWLEQGLTYSRAVFMAKIPDIVGHDLWEAQGDTISREMLDFINNYDPADRGVQGDLCSCIKDYLRNNYDLKPGAADLLYHPSMIDTYEDAKTNADGVYQLGSQQTNAVRNPMAMRSLHMLRKVINQLLREKVIDQNTEVHIEYARELNDANKRWAIGEWNKHRNEDRAKYANEIKKLYKEQTGQDIVPTDADILKYELWTEQNHICIYTGKSIGITDFIGPNPQFDIEHTVPRSVGGDSTMANMTLCCSEFNRQVKGAKLPSELSNIGDIMERIAPWKDKIENYRKEADKLRTHSGMAKEVKDSIIRKRHTKRLSLEYWQDKYHRFEITEAPEGFSRRQGAGIGLVGKYAGLYLRSLFHKTDDRLRSNVRVVKGATTAEFRKMWGIQDEYEKKSRDNHIHHCIDAIVIACINTGDYNAVARYYRQYEEYERQRESKPTFAKPWPTFTEDIKALAEDILVVHDTPDNFAKRAHKMVFTAKGKHIAQGDSVRRSLHKDTYYGAIRRGDETRYVVRRALSSFEKATELDTIVDDTVRDIIKHAVKEQGFKEAMANPIYMNKEKGILIKKVRCYANAVKRPIEIRTHRDVSVKDYKRSYFVQNDENYLLAIYEGANAKGKPDREFKLVKNIEAAQQLKSSARKSGYQSVVPEKSPKGYALKHKLTIGRMVLLYESTPDEIDFSNSADLARRLYKITGLAINPTGKGYGSIFMRHHQEARMASDIKPKNGAFVNGEELRPSIIMLHTQFRALVQGEDFEINALGEITPKH